MIVFALTEVFKMSQNQKSNLLGWLLNKFKSDNVGEGNRINYLQKDIDNAMKEKNMSVDDVFKAIREIVDFASLQEQINKEVNEKLTSEGITQWQPIKFLFLTEGNIIKILSIMAKSGQKLNKDQSKMMSPIIKKMLLDNKNVDNLIPQIKEEQILCFDDDLLKKIPMDRIKKFTSQQINCFTGKQVAILLNREDEGLYDHIAQNIDINKIFDRANNTDTLKLIIDKLPVDKFADLKKESIKSLSTSLIRRILKKSYESQKYLSPDQLSGVVSEIPGILNIFSEKYIKTASKSELEFLIHYIAPEEVKNIKVAMLTNLSLEMIKKFNSDQIKSFNTDQIITLLKRNDCSDYIIDNLTAEQIYNMDFQKLLELDTDIIKEFVTKHEQKIFVSDRNAYLNNLGIVHEDKNAKVTNAELGENQVDQYSRFCEHTQSFIEALLDNNKYDLDELILSKLTQSHLSRLSSKMLLRLISSEKIPLLKQNKNMSIDILTHWLDKKIGIHPSKQINGKWICDSVNLYLDNNKFSLVRLGHKLIIDFNKIISRQQKESWKVVEPYIATIYKNKAMKDIKDFNHQLSLVETQGLNENDRAKIDKLFSEAYLSCAGQEIAQNLSGDVIKFLNAKQIDLLIKYGVLKHFPEDRINCFNEEEISKLDVESIQNLSLLFIEARKKSDALQLPTKKDFYEEWTSLSTRYKSESMSEEDKDKLIKIYDIINLNKYQKFVDTYILYFSPKQLKELLKNGDSFLLPDTVQKIEPKILFSGSEDDRKNILWKIDVMKLDFSKFGEPVYKNNFLTLDTCKKFSDTQIETIIKSENIKYLDPKFLIELPDEKIKTFNTTHLTDKQISTLIDQDKFKYLNPEIISNTNMKNCLSNINSSDILSQEQQKKLIDSKLFVDLKDKALENFDSDLIVRKLNYKTTGQEFIQNELLTKNLAEKNKIQKLNPDVIKEFTVKQIQILSQYENLNLTDEQIDILLQKNYIPYFNTNFVASKLTQEQVEKIKSIVQNQDYAALSGPDKTCITIDQLVSLSNTDKFRYISTEALNQANSKSLTPKGRQRLNLKNATAEQINILFANGNFSKDQIGQLLQNQEFAEINSDIIKTVGKNITIDQLQKLNLKNATAEQINILFANNNFSEDQIGQLLPHEGLANIDSDIIKKIGTNITINQLTKLNFKKMESNQLENFFTGCKANSNLKNQDLNQLFNNSQSIDAVTQSPAFQEFYLHHVADNNKINIHKLDDIILLGKKSNFAKDKIFLRIVQHKLSIPENQTNASQTNNAQKPIDPHMRKSYKKFIETMDNEDVKYFDFTNAGESFVDFLPIEKLLNLDVSIIQSSEAMQNKLAAKRNNIRWWINFWNHVPLIGRIYEKFKSPLLENINNKLDQPSESRESNPELNTTQKKINETKDDNESKTNTNTKKENNNGNYETNITNSSQEK